MEKISGYFTLEKNIEGLNLHELTLTLGLRPGELASGARVLLLLRQPLVGQFVFAGSTFVPGADELVDIAQRRNFPIPHAWLGQRLVKVMPIARITSEEKYPRAKSAVEQWQLVVPVAAEEVGRLATDQQKYWRRR